MSEKQTIEEYHFKPEEVFKAFQAAGYNLPGTPSEMRIGCRENSSVLVLWYVRKHDSILGDPHKQCICQGDVEADGCPVHESKT